VLASVGAVVGYALSGVAVAAFAGWFAVSVLNQTQRTRRVVGKLVAYDLCGLIPIWTFFAPNPGDTDLHLLVRDRGEDGRVADWREVRLAGRRRLSDLWNPRRRINKALVDVAFDLTRPAAAPEGGERPVPEPAGKERVLSFPYLLILAYVSRLEGDFGAAERQFALARTAGLSGRGRPDVLLVSPFHALS
jgi:hypothetical protein